MTEQVADPELMGPRDVERGAICAASRSHQLIIRRTVRAALNDSFGVGGYGTERDGGIRDRNERHGYRGCQRLVGSNGERSHVDGVNLNFVDGICTVGRKENSVTECETVDA